jgi:HD-GYP domain-containing protein (c-di-GMP phosphodiesterase class II)
MRELAAHGSSGNFSVRAMRKDHTIIGLGLQDVRADYEGEPAIIGMAQDITERQRAQSEIQRYTKLLEHTAEATLQAVAAMVEQRDPYTAGHERRVGALAAAIGREMGWSEHAAQGLNLCGMVHDIGKIAVPAEILSKPTRLNDIEMALVRMHAQTGFDVLKNVDFPWPVAEVIYQHHERLDGTGYPRKLKGDAILPETRIMMVADVVESMSSHRPYRPGLGLEAALQEIETHSGTWYDPQVVAACLRLFREKGYTLPN